MPEPALFTPDWFRWFAARDDARRARAIEVLARMAAQRAEEAA